MLSRRSLETLIDLVENKLTDIVPFDRDDMKEIKALKSCADELKGIRDLAQGDIASRPVEKAPMRAAV